MFAIHSRNMCSALISAKKIWLGNQTEVALKLMEYGCELNLQNKEGWSSLMIATRYNQPEVALKLIQNGCELNLHNENGWSSLMIATRYNQPEVALQLMEHGCELDFKNDKGNNALTFAIKFDELEVVEKLIENGCQISGNENNDSVKLNMKFLEKNAILIHHVISFAKHIYEDFPKELLPFLIRSDVIPTFYWSQDKLGKRKATDLSENGRKKPKLV